MLRVMPEIRGRGTGGFVEYAVVKALHDKAKASGEPDALKGASPVRGGVVWWKHMHVICWLFTLLARFRVQVPGCPLHQYGTS